MTPPAAHETAGVLRMHRGRMSAPQICRILNISKQQLIHELNAAIDDENTAHEAGIPIHDATVKREPPSRCSTCGEPETKSKYAKDIKVGEILTEHGAVVVATRPIYEGSTAPARIVFSLSTGLTHHYAPYDKVRYEEEI